MMVLFQATACPACERLRDTLDDLCVPHRVVTVAKDTYAPLLDYKGHLTVPVLVDDHATYQGHGEIERHIEELASFKALWEKYQTDACYCDEYEESSWRAQRACPGESVDG